MSRAGHDEQDSDCIYWTGDRAGYNLRAVCRTCAESRAQLHDGEAEIRRLTAEGSRLRAVLGLAAMVAAGGILGVQAATGAPVNGLTVASYIVFGAGLIVLLFHRREP